MPSNLEAWDDMARIEARMTADEILEVLGISMAEFLQSLPTGSVDDLIEYMEND